ncbi:MAG: hypothetical protein KDJ65_00415 [Anaerolineae bacterium]|nr:hypothetical protein [Anaerolineae bacterium]
MACESRSRQLALVSTVAGIPTTASQRGFYAALAAGTALGALLLGRWLTRPNKSLSNQPGSVPTLTGQLQLDPIPGDQLQDQQCSGCRSKAQDKRGLWYTIRGSTYCPDCAPIAARQGGFSLGVRSASMKRGAVFNPDDTPSVAIKLKPGRVRIGVTQVEGYTVLRARDRQETGLTITPEFKIDSNGQVQVNKNSWFVNYDRVGQPVGGPFRTRQEAEGLASELARFDWKRSIEEFSDEEIRGSVSLANNYRENLTFKKYMEVSQAS